MHKLDNLHTIETLKDIRDLAEIPDISFYFFIAAISIALLFIGSMIFIGIRHYRKNKTFDTKKEVLKRLREVDFSNSKQAAYQITRYGRYLADEERSQKILAQLIPKLEKYKFVKNPPEFRDADIKYYDLFLESLDE